MRTPRPCGRGHDAPWEASRRNGPRSARRRRTSTTQCRRRPRRAREKNVGPDPARLGPDPAVERPRRVAPRGRRGPVPAAPPSRSARGDARSNGREARRGAPRAPQPSCRRRRAAHFRRSPTKSRPRRPLAGRPDELQLDHRKSRCNCLFFLSGPFGRHRRRTLHAYATLLFVVAIVVGGVVVAIVVGGVVVGLLVGLVLSRPRTCPRGLRTFCRSRPNANLANLAPMGSAPWDHPVPKAPPSPLMVRNLWLPALADAVKGAESTVGGGRRRRHRRNRNGGNFSEIKNRTAPRLFKLAQRRCRLKS